MDYRLCQYLERDGVQCDHLSGFGRNAECGYLGVQEILIGDKVIVEAVV